MIPKKENRNVGRPRKKIDYVIVERLAAIMCTEAEIAAVLGVCVRTLQRDEEFCRIYKKGMDAGRASIRRSQFEMMKAGNATMAVWLGKQYLGQKDQIKNDVDITQPIRLVVDEVDMDA
jgi:hypothetical protein